MLNMNYTIPSIPTTYKGRKYRSRLEAKWAAFFDLCEWRYEYEPLDLNGWFPDFALYGDKGNMILVEVKPVIKFPSSIAKKINKSSKGCRELLILGQGPFLSSDLIEIYSIGWLMEIDYACDYWDEAIWGQWELSNKPGFCHKIGSYQDRISGFYDGGCYGAGYSQDVELLWNEAGNIVQYKV